MAGTRGKQRGSEPQDAVRAARIRRRWLVALLGTTLVAGAVAIALAVREESCDIGPTLNPQDRAIICAMRNQETPRCPPEELTPEECAEILDQFNHPAG
jgi:hypothetical protein